MAVQLGLRHCLVLVLFALCSLFSTPEAHAMRLKMSSSSITSTSSTWTPPSIKINGVSLTTFGAAGNLRGIVATSQVGGEDVAKSSPLVSVPGNMVFEVTNTRPPTPFPNFVSQQQWEKSMWDQRLAFKMLHAIKVAKIGQVQQQGQDEEAEVKEEQDRKAWLKQLPDSFSTPLHWNSKVLKEELQYEALVKKVDRQKLDWKLIFDEWKAASLPESKKITFDEFVWALECVNSRAFSGTYEGSSAGERQALFLFTGALTIIWPLANFGTWEQSLSAAVVVGLSILARDVFFGKAAGLKRYVVCPYVDMFNHKSTCQSDVSYNYFSNQFELRTESYAPGDQVFISYGKQSNDRLLQYYGFVDENNPYDSYDFGQGFLELMLKYGDKLGSIVPLPQSPSPSDRLKTIAASLRITEVQDSTVGGGKKDSTSRAYEISTRFFRTAPSSSSSSATTTANDAGNENAVQRILDQASFRKSALARFDDVTVRSMRALYASTAEWDALLNEKKNIGNLDKLGPPLSANTEKLVNEALAALAALELKSKPTSLQEDERLLAASMMTAVNDANKSPVIMIEAEKKGFGGAKVSPSSSTTAASKTAAAAAVASSPSGAFSDSLISAIAFRIEKKKLLGEALQSTSNAVV